MATLSPKPEEVITVRTQGRVAIVTLANPKKLNALRLADYYRLSSVLQDIAAMPDITVAILTGTGRFFSAGADVSATRPGADGGHPHEVRDAILRGFVANNIDITRTFYTFPKILVVALNGPTVGVSAGLLGFADFVYATPHAYLLTPFSSLGLVAEGGASFGLVQRMGISLANEALLCSRKISSERLLQSGFVNKIFSGKDEKDSDGFLKQVLEEVDDKLGEHLNQSSILGIKKLIRAPYLNLMEQQGVREVIDGMQRFVEGYPQKEFALVASGKKKHKL